MKSGRRLLWAEVALATSAFAALSIAVLTVAAQTAEPDDGAYRASIVAITDGHLFTLTNAQATDLAASLNDNPTEPPNQWTQLPDGHYISEKDPGYPYLAAPFESLGIIRWAPLFYGALACVGLFVGARRWLGRFGGAAAVGLFCSSGAALAFAWRDYMPTFTDTSLVAAGTGALLWAVVASESSIHRRTWVGLAGFVAIELATFVRYTNVVILGCAVVAVILVWWRRPTLLPLRRLCWGLASVVVFAAGVLSFDDRIYGGPLTTGYQPGEVTFALDAMTKNLSILPKHLMKAMPMLVLGLVAVVWIVARAVMLRRNAADAGAVARRDLWVGLALAASWLSIWALYFAYTWTLDPTNVTVQLVRFYLPAIGAISLLGAWLVTRIPGPAWRAGSATLVTTAVLFGLGVWSFHAMYAAFGVPLSG